jgi:hypothetical protein
MAGKIGIAAACVTPSFRGYFATEPESPEW